MSKPIIEVENLGKSYALGSKEPRHRTFQEAIVGALTAPARRLRELRGQAASAGDEFWALKDVSFTVNRGDVVGVIGRNGAGKSTLLKILSRITEPTTGRAILRGRVASLLEVGTGFHAELTGRENIYLNGSILGLSKREIDRKFDEIVDFAEVEKFLDTPVKRYSSGMYVRLAFAVAAHLEPEILIVDEVLAVGDVQFQKKCLGKMQEVSQGEGRTVLFVSHNLAAVEALCTYGIVLEAGSILYTGKCETALKRYRDQASTGPNLQGPCPFARNRYLKGVDFLDHEGTVTNDVLLGKTLIIRVLLVAAKSLRNPHLGIGIDSFAGERMLTVQTPADKEIFGELSQDAEVFCRIPQLPLPPGDYTLKITLTESMQELESLTGVASFSVSDSATLSGRGFHRGKCIAQSEWWISQNDSDWS